MGDDSVRQSLSEASFNSEMKCIPLEGWSGEHPTCEVADVFLDVNKCGHGVALTGPLSSAEPTCNDYAQQLSTISERLLHQRSDRLLKMNRKKRKASGGRATNSSQMIPALWRTLPKELLLLVFSRLPLPDITRVRSLSKEWNRDMAMVNSDINRACDEARPKTVAVCTSDGFYKSEILVSICTPRSQYAYHLHLGNGGWDDMGACDGGLVCFVSTWRLSKASPLCIVVVNLLTRVRRKLPPLKHLYLTPPQMMHIEVDSETKCYRVVVIGKNIKGVCPTVEIYDSSLRQWTKVTPPVGSIFGVTYSWFYGGSSRGFMSVSETRSVYDFAEGRLRRCDENVPSQGASVETYAIQKDSLFVLHRNTSNDEMLPAAGYCITQYCSQNNAKDWVQERSYLCSSSEARLEDFRLWTLKACEGVVMVLQYVPFNPMKFWFLDLSTGEWSRPLNSFEGHMSFTSKRLNSMSRAFWNVVP